MNKLRDCSWVLPLVLALTARGGRAQGPSASPIDPKAMEREVAHLVEAHHGQVAFYAEQMNTGRSMSWNPDTPVQTASVIKLSVLFEAMEQVRSGKASWNEKVTLAPGDAVSGSGVLGLLDAPLVLTLKDLLTLMVVLSDNTATNLAIERLGLESINARIAWMGLKDTHLYKKVMKPSAGPMPADQPRFGLGKTTAREMARVMERIGRCELTGAGEPTQPGDAAICTVALGMLKNQFYRDTIPRYLEALDTSEAGGSAIASKTGSLDAVRADVAIVAGKSGPILLSIFTYGNADKSWTSDNEGELTIAKLARAIVGAWSPEGTDARTLVPGLVLSAMDKNGASTSK